MNGTANIPQLTPEEVMKEAAISGISLAKALDKILKIRKETEEKEFGRVKCDTCGCVIHWPVMDNDIMSRCANCRLSKPSFCGNTNDGHYDDDMSGSSGSWDMAVKIVEGDYERN